MYNVYSYTHTHTRQVFKIYKTINKLNPYHVTALFSKLFEKLVMSASVSARQNYIIIWYIYRFRLRNIGFTSQIVLGPSIRLPAKFAAPRLSAICIFVWLLLSVACFTRHQANQYDVIYTYKYVWHNENTRLVCADNVRRQ